MFQGFRQFEEDPFFRDHRERMRSNFGGFDRFFASDPFALEEPRDRHDRGGGIDARDRGREVVPRDVFGGMFGHMNSMFSNMDKHFERAANDPNSFTYSQSSVMTYSNDGCGDPKVFQAHTSTKRAPGGIKETKKALKDSESGLERMAIGHHIGDRGRVVERSLNRRTNEEERKQDFINMDENDAPSFDNEWNHRTRTAMHSLGDVRKDTRRALEEPRKRHDRGRGRLENREERGHHRAFAPDHAEPDNYRGRGDEYRRRDEDYRGYREDRREHGEDYRGRGREKARDHERKVRVNSRPTNKHQPRGSLD